LTAPAEDLPFEDNEFDISVLINTLEFLDDPVEALMEAGRVTRRKVFVGILNGLSWSGMLKKINGLLGDPLFGRAHLYNIWQLKSMIHAAYGSCPTSRRTLRARPQFTENMWFPGKETLDRSNSPFVSFQGISVQMVNRMKTDNLPIKLRFKPAGRSLAGINTMGEINRLKGVSNNERGLSV
jgi:SAM-dependent methyltransferase